MALAFDHATFRGEEAVAQGWLELASRALAGLELVPEHGLLATWEADFAIEAADTDLAEQKAARAIEIGVEVGDADVELMGRAQEGLVKVVRGDVDAGMRLLDASAAAAVAGEFHDPAFAGYACCYLISVCSLVRDLDRAAQWCAELDPHCARVGYHSLQHLCRVEYAGVLVEQGDWIRAETEMLTAAQFLGTRRPPKAVEAIVRLGELRRRQGRVDEATERFKQAEGHPKATLGLGAIALDAGDGARAVDVAEMYLRQFGPHDRIGRFGGMELLANAQAVIGDLDAALTTLEELRTTVASMSREPLVAAVRQLDGTLLLAAGDPAASRGAVEDTVHLNDRAGAPFGAARARALLGRVFLAAGDTQAAEREAKAAASAFDHLGAVADAEWARQLPGRPMETPPIIQREVDVLRLVADGLNNAEIAKRLVLSEHTVHRHVANTLRELGVSTRAAAVARASALGLI